MPTTIALVPITHPDSGKHIAAGEEITLGDEDYYDMRSDGKVAASAQEQKANQHEATPEGTYRTHPRETHSRETHSSSGGVYNARTSRQDAGAPEAEAKAQEKK